MKVRDIMSQDVAWCTPQTRLQEIAQLMLERDCGAIPVIDDQEHRRLIGVVTDRDITCRIVAQGRNPLDLTAADCMSSPVFSVNPDTDEEECCRAMEEHQVRRIPVTESDGSCCGIVSQADIALKGGDEHETAELVKDVSQPSRSSHA